MSHEHLVRAQAAQRGWSVVRGDREIGAVGVPCFIAPRIAGNCDIWVGTASDSDTLHVSHDWQKNAAHAAHVRGIRGALFDRSGTKSTRGQIGSDASSCTLSLKPRGRHYESAWDALHLYVKAVYSLFVASAQQPDAPEDRPYTFEVESGRSGEAVAWRSMMTCERVAIVGLGGIGAWVADFVIKCDPQEVHGWDPDSIEPKNILRMPGGTDPEHWVGRMKSAWFQCTYGRVHKNVRGHHERVTAENVQRVVKEATFAFVAVDCDEDRMTICDAFAAADVPFVVTGVSLEREQQQVTVAIRIVTGHSGVESWRKAIPQVGSSGQDDYGSLDVPDVYAMAASWAVQAWRKMRGQIRQDATEECVVYRASAQSLVVRTVE